MARGYIGEILHFGAVRYRVNGDGNLLSYLSDLDNVNTSQLTNIAMVMSTSRESVLLANFNSQRACLIIQTTAIDEAFTISKIIIFVKPVASGYPQ